LAIALFGLNLPGLCYGWQLLTLGIGGNFFELILSCGKAGTKQKSEMRTNLPYPGCFLTKFFLFNFPF